MKPRHAHHGSAVVFTACINQLGRLRDGPEKGARMAGTTQVVSKQQRAAATDKQKVYSAACRVSEWLERNRYEGYDTFDGLNSRLLRPLTFNRPLLRMVLQQGIRRFPINLRPLVGVDKSPSTKAM